MLSAHGSTGPLKTATLKEESEDLPAEMFSPGLFVVHDPPGSGHHNVAELSGGQQVRGPLLNVCDGDIEPGNIKFIINMHSHFSGSRMKKTAIMNCST